MHLQAHRVAHGGIAYGYAQLALVVAESRIADPHPVHQHRVNAGGHQAQPHLGRRLEHPQGHLAPALNVSRLVVPHVEADVVVQHVYRVVLGKVPLSLSYKSQ